jgi:hypothetical protein
MDFSCTADATPGLADVLENNSKLTSRERTEAFMHQFRRHRHNMTNQAGNVGGGFAVTGAKTYVDTITLFSRQPLAKTIFKDVRRFQKKPIVSDEKPIIGRDGFRIGTLFFNSIHQPTISTLNYLAPLQGKEFVLHTVHAAYDFLVANEMEAQNAQLYFQQHLHQPWRRPQACNFDLNSAYWKEDKRAPRNIAIYSDRSSKTGAGHCSHLELRFTGSDACRRAGLSILSSIANGGVDTQRLLKRQAKISIADLTRLERAIGRMARQFLPMTQTRRPELRLDALTAKMRQLLVRGLGGVLMDDTVIASSICSQEVWDSAHRTLRAALVEVPWEQITPKPVWHAWR